MKLSFISGHGTVWLCDKCGLFIEFDQKHPLKVGNLLEAENFTIVQPFAFCPSCGECDGTPEENREAQKRIAELLKVGLK